MLQCQVQWQRTECTSGLLAPQKLADPSTLHGIWTTNLYLLSTVYCHCASRQNQMRKMMWRLAFWYTSVDNHNPFFYQWTISCGYEHPELNNRRVCSPNLRLACTDTLIPFASVSGLLERNEMLFLHASCMCLQLSALWSSAAGWCVCTWSHCFLQEVEYSFVPMYSTQTRCSFELFGSDVAGLQFVDRSEESSVMRKVADLVLDIPIIQRFSQRSRSMLVKLAFGRAEIGVSARDAITGKSVSATAKFAASWDHSSRRAFQWIMDLIHTLGARCPAWPAVLLVFEMCNMKHPSVGMWPTVHQRSGNQIAPAVVQIMQMCKCTATGNSSPYKKKSYVAYIQMQRHLLLGPAA